MLNYIYMTTDVETGEFYIGKRSTAKYIRPEDDPYIGSGKWIRKMSPERRSRLIKIVIEVLPCHLLLNEIEKYYIDMYYDNMLNKNMTLGGDGASPAEFNINHSDKKYHIINIKTKEEMWATQYQMREITNRSFQTINTMLTGKCNRCGDWTLFENRHLKFITTPDEQFSFFNVITEETLIATAESFRKLTGASKASVSFLITGKRKSSKNWILKNTLE